MSSRVALIGAGKIGEALLNGALAAGKPAKEIVVAGRSAETTQTIGTEYGVRTTQSVADAVDGAELVVIAVKPDAVPAVMRDIASVEDSGDTERLVVSLAAGLSIAYLESFLPAGAPVVRVMPNTPMMVNEAMCGVAAGRYVSPEQLDSVIELLESVGKVAVIPEKNMDALTALSGSGPAYAFLVAEAMIDAGVNLGLSRALATELAAQTIKGAGVLMTTSGLSPVELRAAVTSPGGTTAEAIRELEVGGLRAAFYQAMRANAARSKALGTAEPEGGNGAN